MRQQQPTSTTTTYVWTAHHHQTCNIRVASIILSIRRGSQRRTHFNWRRLQHFPQCARDYCVLLYSLSLSDVLNMNLNMRLMMRCVIGIRRMMKQLIAECMTCNEECAAKCLVFSMLRRLPFKLDNVWKNHYMIFFLPKVKPRYVLNFIGFDRQYFAVDGHISNSPAHICGGDCLR